MYTFLKKDIFTSMPYHVGETVLTDNTTTLLHNHEFFEFFIVTEGGLIHRCNGENAGIKRMELHLVRPDDAHCYTKDARCPRAGFWNLAVPSELFGRVSGLLFADEERPVTRASCSLDQSAYDDALNKLKTLRSQYFRGIKSGGLLETLAAELLYQLGRAKDTGAPPVPAWLSLCCEEMRSEDNFVAGVNRFYELAGKTREHACRSMKRYYNRTPTEFVNYLRVSRAGEEIAATNKGVLQIAQDAGFDSVSQFNKLFKARFGTNPSSYRKYHRLMTNK